jgi:tyrosine-protein phosphatase YwqE
MTIDEYEAELERHRAEKHQMHKKVGGYKTEIAKLTERVRALEEQVKEQDIKKDIMAGNGIDIVTS